MDILKRINDRRGTWQTALAEALHAIRIRPYAATGFSPHYLTFGTLPRLRSDEDVLIASKWPPVDEARRLAAIALEKQADQIEARLSTNCHPDPLQVGDKVLLKSSCL